MKTYTFNKTDKGYIGNAFEMAIKDFGDNEFRKDNFILLNLAVGGNFPGIWDINQITALSDGPAEMEIDYVRVFQKNQ